MSEIMHKTEAEEVPAEAATTGDSRSNDEKHASLLKGAGEARVRTREELTHRVATTSASSADEKARKRNIAIGLVLAVVVVAVVLALLMVLGANSTI